MRLNTYIEMRSLFRNSLKEIYPLSDIDSITRLVFEHVTGIWSNNQVELMKSALAQEQQSKVIEILERLKTNEPVQYILGTAHFYDLVFEVNRNVLIPRQETELIVHEIIKHPRINQIKSILDIGTGSGCIAITLKKNLPEKKVFALDISMQALDLARRNARLNQVEVDFFEEDILNPNTNNQTYDLIVSNPPYVRESEKSLMHENVKDFEPSIALFVPDSSPLVYYEAIARYASYKLSAKGFIAVEINEALASDTSEVFRKSGLSKYLLIKDLNEKDRILIFSRQ